MYIFQVIDNIILLFDCIKIVGGIKENLYVAYWLLTNYSQDGSSKSSRVILTNIEIIAIL